MTYNFDPDRWYDNEYDILKKARDCGAVSEKQFEEAVDGLQDRYQEMVERLDGTYQLP